MTTYLLGAVLLLGAAYGLLEAWPLLRGPTLEISIPLDNATAPDGIVTVEGSAERVSSLSLSGAPLLREEDGGFSAVMTFPRGGSILTFVAEDRFGRRITETRTIFVPE